MPVLPLALTDIGTATLLVEVGPLRFLTDPVLDPPGGVLHLGGVRFGITGPARDTMDGVGAARAAAALGAERVVPVHYQGWSHFQEGRSEVEAAFGRAGLGGRLTWLRPGTRTPLSPGAAGQGGTMSSLVSS